MLNFNHPNVTTNPELTHKMEACLEAVFDDQRIGFRQMPAREEVWESSLSHAKRISGSSDRAIVIGIGGSSLGGQLLCHSLHSSSFEVDFWDSADPEFISERWSKLESLESIHWIIISKSGGTLETLAIATQVAQNHEKANIPFGQNITVITEEKPSPLSDFAIANRISILPHPQDVGGRFSALTPVGLLPAALVGADLHQVKTGAMKALEAKGLVANIASQIASSWAREEWVCILWPYSEKLRYLSEWFQQLLAESLAKEFTLDGQPAERVSTPLCCLGSKEQHSLLQQISDGAGDKFVLFFSEDLKTTDNLRPNKILFKDMPEASTSLLKIRDAQKQACIDSLIEKQRSVAVLGFDRINSQSIGFSIMLLELVVATLGKHLNINTFDQPGVEMGKKFTKEYLRG